jgi:hypothetical protein
VPRESQRSTLAAALAALALAPLAPAAAQTIALGELPCLPTGENGVLTARIDPPPPAEVEVRLYFRRMHLEVEDFYFTLMEPTGGGAYWGIFPQPEPRAFPPQKLERAPNPDDLWAQWWRTKEGSESRDPNGDLDRDTIAERASVGRRERRDWMAEQDDAVLEEWLWSQRREPAEYFVALVDPAGSVRARSPQRVTVVRDDCEVALTPQQAGYAANLTVGETAPWQPDEAVFHWECTGIVSRLGVDRVLRADESCRACVVAWWPLAAGAGALGLVVVTDDDPGPPQEISPSRP